MDERGFGPNRIDTYVLLAGFGKCGDSEIKGFYLIIEIMKSAIKLVLSYAALAIVFSLNFGCDFAPSGQNAPTGKNPETGNSASVAGTNDSSGASSGYPLLPRAVLDAEVKNLDGTTFKISDKRGKVIILNLWATWCAPCRAEMPTLVRLQDKYREKGLEIIGLNTEESDTREKIERFAGEMKLNYTLVWADLQLQNELVKLSQFPGIPQSFLVDRDGRLRGIFKGGGEKELAKLEEFVDRVTSE